MVIWLQASVNSFCQFSQPTLTTRFAAQLALIQWEIKHTNSLQRLAFWSEMFWISPKACLRSETWYNYLGKRQIRSVSLAFPTGSLHKVTWHSRLNLFEKSPPSLSVCNKMQRKIARPVTTYNLDVYCKDLYLIKSRAHARQPLPDGKAGTRHGGFHKWMMCSEEHNTKQMSITKSKRELH